MKPTSRDRILGLLETTFVVMLTILILYILIEARKQLGIEAESLIEPSWLVLALLPWLIWLIVSGRLTEFSAGSITAKLAKVSTEPVAKAFDQASIGRQIITEMALSAPDAQLKEALNQRPVILKLRLGTPGYTDEGIQKWVERLLESSSFQYVAFVDYEDKLLKYVQANSFLSYIRHSDGKVSERLKNWHISQSIPELRDDRLQRGITNKWAMEYLIKERRDNVAVVDEHGRVIGLLRLSDIVKRYVEHLGIQEEAILTKADNGKSDST